MEGKNSRIIYVYLLLAFYSCRPTVSGENQVHLLHDYLPVPKVEQTMKEGNLINAIVEIPLGTNEKWEVNKETGSLDIEMIDNKKRRVNYLPYPANYGMIPQTLLSKKSGGDCDPLDVFIIGLAQEQGTKVEAKLVGVLKLLDGGEQDDKLVAIHRSSPLYEMNSLDSLSIYYPGVVEILKIWVSNYKGSNKVEFLGMGNELEAKEILNQAILGYQNDKFD